MGAGPRFISTSGSRRKGASNASSYGREGAQSLSVIKDFAWLTSGRLIAALLQAATLILVARRAGPAEFGILSAFMGAIIVVQAMVDLGLPTYITKSRAEMIGGTQAVRALRLYGFIGLLLGVILGAVSLTFSVVAGNAWWWLLPLALAGWLERQSDVRLTIALADGDVWKNSLNLVVRRGVAILLLLLGINLQWDAIPAFGAASLLAALLSWVLSRRLVVLEEVTEPGKWSEARQIIRDSRAYWANSLGAQVRNLDVLLVGLMGNPVAAGQYGAVSRSIGPLRMVTASLSTVLLPAAVRFKGEQRRKLRWAIIAILSLMSALYILLVIFSKDIVVLLLGTAYAPASFAFQLVVIGLIFASITSVLTPLLQAEGQQAVVGRASLSFSLVSLAGVAAGTYFGGVTGAGAGLAITYAFHCMVLICVFVFSHRKKLEVSNA
ncbi:lipopolysaccharide biosynthesis protein [Kocuria sabuli]|uniref:lipopolysaccharide biosynthesis protein n=1 Tax=Kocuria sabuli TaxID=3071448 RepID=UPI0034D50CA4